MIHHKILKWLEDNHLWDRWSGTHAIVGAFLAWLLAFYLPPMKAWMTVMLIALVWETYEVKIDGTARTYGSVKAWFLNSVSDIFYAGLMAFFVLSSCDL